MLALISIDLKTSKFINIVSISFDGLKIGLDFSSRNPNNLLKSGYCLKIKSPKSMKFGAFRSFWLTKSRGGEDWAFRNSPVGCFSEGPDCRAAPTTQNKNSQAIAWLLYAEEEGFEPPVPHGTTVFKTAAIDHSATPLCCVRSFRDRKSKGILFLSNELTHFFF